MELPCEPRARAELGLDPPPEPRVQVEPRDFRLVLVGHELVELEGDRLGERGRLGNASPLGRVNVDHVVHESPRVLDVLVGLEIRDADREQGRQSRLGWSADALDQRARGR